MGATRGGIDPSVTMHSFFLFCNYVGILLYDRSSAILTSYTIPDDMVESIVSLKIPEITYTALSINLEYLT